MHDPVSNYELFLRALQFCLEMKRQTNCTSIYSPSHIYNPLRQIGSISFLLLHSRPLTSIIYNILPHNMSTANTSALLEPTTIGGLIPLSNSICMGSMTRNRCIDGNKPTEASVAHYAARAKDGTGLIVAEGTFIYWSGCDWLHTPVMFKEEHVYAWKKITDAVHKEGGKIFFQAWHAGKIFFM